LAVLSVFDAFAVRAWKYDFISSATFIAPLWLPLVLVTLVIRILSFGSTPEKVSRRIQLDTAVAWISIAALVGQLGLAWTINEMKKAGGFNFRT
jgi:hypothetical protein